MRRMFAGGGRRERERVLIGPPVPSSSSVPSAPPYAPHQEQSYLQHPSEDERESMEATARSDEEARTTANDNVRKLPYAFEMLVRHDRQLVADRLCLLVSMGIILVVTCFVLVSFVLGIANNATRPDQYLFKTGYVLSFFFPIEDIDQYGPVPVTEDEESSAVEEEDDEARLTLRGMGGGGLTRREVDETANPCLELVPSVGDKTWLCVAMGHRGKPSRVPYQRLPVPTSEVYERYIYEPDPQVALDKDAGHPSIFPGEVGWHSLRYDCLCRAYNISSLRDAYEVFSAANVTLAQSVFVDGDTTHQGDVHVAKKLETYGEARFFSHADFGESLSVRSLTVGEELVLPETSTQAICTACGGGGGGGPSAVNITEELLEGDKEAVFTELTVLGDTNITQRLTVANLTILEAFTYANLSVETLTVEEAVSVGTDLSVGGDLSASSLSVERNSTLNGVLTASAGVMVSAGGLSTDELEVRDDAHMLGVALVDEELTSMGTFFANSSVYLTGPTHVLSTLEVLGSMYGKDAYLSGQIVAVGAIYGDSLSLNKTLKVTKHSEFDSLQANGDAVFGAELRAEQNARVEGNTTLNGTLAVARESTFEEAVRGTSLNLSSSLDVYGDARLHSDLLLVGSFTLQGTQYATDENVTLGVLRADVGIIHENITTKDLFSTGSASLSELEVLDSLVVSAPYGVYLEKLNVSTLNVNGSVLRAIGLYASGDATVVGIVRAQGDYVDVSGDLTVHGDLIAKSNFAVEGTFETQSTSVAGMLTVSEAAIFDSTGEFGDELKALSLRLTGLLGKNLYAAGASFSDDVDFDGDITCTGGGEFGGSLSAYDGTFLGKVTCSSLSVTASFTVLSLQALSVNASTLKASLSIESGGSGTFGGAISANGAGTFGGKLTGRSLETELSVLTPSLNVSTEASIANLTVPGEATFQGKARFDGSATFDSISSESSVNASQSMKAPYAEFERLSVTGEGENTTFGGDVYVKGTLYVAGNTTTVQTTYENVTITNTISALSDVEVGGSVAVTGNVSTASHANFSKTIDVYGESTFRDEVHSLADMTVDTTLTADIISATTGVQTFGTILSVGTIRSQDSFRAPEFGNAGIQARATGNWVFDKYPVHRTANSSVPLLAGTDGLISLDGDLVASGYVRTYPDNAASDNNFTLRPTCPANYIDPLLAGGVDWSDTAALSTHFWVDNIEGVGHAEWDLSGTEECSDGTFTRFVNNASARNVLPGEVVKYSFDYINGSVYMKRVFSTFYESENVTISEENAVFGAEIDVSGKSTLRGEVQALSNLTVDGWLLVDSLSTDELQVDSITTTAGIDAAGTVSSEVSVSAPKIGTSLNDEVIGTGRWLFDAYPIHRTSTSSASTAGDSWPTLLPGNVASGYLKMPPSTDGLAGLLTLMCSSDYLDEDLGGWSDTSALSTHFWIDNTEGKANVTWYLTTVCDADDPVQFVGIGSSRNILLGEVVKFSFEYVNGTVYLERVFSTFNDTDVTVEGKLTVDDDILLKGDVTVEDKLTLGTSGMRVPISSVTQVSTTSTSVTINAYHGFISMVAATFNSGSGVSFQVQNNVVTQDSLVIMSVCSEESATQLGFFLVTAVDVHSGGWTTVIYNTQDVTSGSLTIRLGFVVYSPPS